MACEVNFADYIPPCAWLTLVITAPDVQCALMPLSHNPWTGMHWKHMKRNVARAMTAKKTMSP